MHSRLVRVLLYSSGPVALGLLLVLVAAHFTGRPLAIAIEFRPTLDGTALDCGKPVFIDEAATGARRESVMLAGWQLLVADIRMVRVDGKLFDLDLGSGDEWQSGPYALLRVGDGSGTCGATAPESRQTVRGSAPMGNYVGVRFRLLAAADVPAGTGPQFFRGGSPLTKSGSDELPSTGFVTLRAATLDSSGEPVFASETTQRFDLDAACPLPGSPAPCKGRGTEVTVMGLAADRPSIGIEIGALLHAALADRFPGMRASVLPPPFYARTRKAGG